MSLECIIKVSHPAGVPWLGCADPVVIKLLSVIVAKSGWPRNCHATIKVSQVWKDIDRPHAFWKEEGLFQVGEHRLCDQLQMIQKKGWQSQLQLEEIRRLVESGVNNVKAQQEKQSGTETEPIQQVPEQNIAQNEEDEGRVDEHDKLLINYDNIDTEEKQNILEKIVELKKKHKLADPRA